MIHYFSLKVQGITRQPVKKDGIYLTKINNMLVPMQFQNCVVSGPLCTFFFYFFIFLNGMIVLNRCYC